MNKFLALTLALGLLAPPALARANSIDWYTIAGGGGTVSAGPYTLSGTIGQADASPTVTGGPYALTGGFWSIALPSAVPAPAGLVAWWPANGNAVDVVGGNNGTLTNGLGYVAGEVGQAFDPTNNHAGVFIGNPTALQLQNFTIEGWVKRASTSMVTDDSTAGGLAAAIFYFGSQGYGMGRQSSGAISLTKIDSDSIDDGVYGASVTDTNWHHVAVTKFGTNVSFYVDGVAYPSRLYTSTFQFNTPAAIGVRGDSANLNGSFAGAIDELSIYDRGLTPAEILSIYHAGSAGKYLAPSAPVAAPSGMVAWWPANDNAVDVVGGNNGTLTNGVAYVSGEVGEAFELPNDHAGVCLGNSTALQLQNFTVEAWVRRASTSLVTDDPSANGAAAAIFYFGSQGYGVGMQSDGAISLAKIDGAYITEDAAAARVTDTDWHHIAVTKSNTITTFFIDGVAYPPMSYGATFQFNTPAAIGVRGDYINTNNNDSFAGAIDELAIYNRALTAAEIQSIYNAGSAGKYYTPPPAVAAPSGMVAWWPANGNAVDVVGGNNGTLTNGVTYVPGEVQQTFNLNASSAMVLLSNSPALQLQNFTVEAWIQRGSLTSVTSDGHAVGGNALMFGYGDSGYSFAMGPGGNLILTWVDHDDVVSSAAITDTAWHHVAVTTTNGTVVFYLDGVAGPAASYPRTYTFATAPAIGGRADNLNQPNNDSFLGSIDELSVYNSALTASAIQSIYIAGAKGKVISAVSDYVVTTGNQLGIFNWQTGQYAVLGALNEGSGLKIEDMAHLPGGTVYGSDSAYNFVTINPATLAVNVIGPMGDNIAGLVVRPDGTLFGFSHTSLYTINTNTGTPTLVGALGATTSTYYDAKFDTLGNLYFTEANELYTINTTSGAATLLGPIGFSMYGLGFENGTLYGFTASGQILVINTSTGAGTFLLNQSQSNPIFAASSGGLVTPEPATYDVVADFSTNANPNGVWSYGWATGAGAPFQLMASPAVNFLPGDSGWTNGEAFPDTCYVDRNFSGSPIQDGTVSLDPDTLHMQPLTQASIVRFTAPASGAYQVAGLFRLQDTGTQPHNLTILLRTNIGAYFVYTSGGTFGEQYPFSFPCVLSAGQTIDFIVSYVDTDGNLETGLKATITPLTNTVYSAVADFNTTANPNGVWSYVFWPNNNLGGNAQLLFTNIYPVTAQSNIFAWWDGGSTASENSVIIADDDTGNSVPETGYPNVVYYPDTLFEGPQALPVATRFTAPATGSYLIQGFFRVQDSSLAASGNAALLEVITNANASSPEFSANSQSQPLATQYPFTFTNLLTQGETVDFATVGADGHVNNLSSGVSVYITPLFAVLPAPSAPPLLQSVQLSGGNLTFAFQSVNSQSYTVQTTTNLSAPNWVNLSTVTGTGALLPVSVPVNVNLTNQFYRLSFP